MLARRLWLRFETLFRRERVAQQLDDEIQFHLDEQIAEYVAAGMSREEAHHAAMRCFGNPTLLKETTMETWGWAALEGMGQDLRLGIRLLRLNPAFAAVAILSISLGIGANTAIFQLLDAVILRTLPVTSPEQLASVQMIHEGRVGSSVARQNEFSSAIWQQLDHQQQAFSDIAAWSSAPFNLGHGGEARYAAGIWVSGSFFHVLQVNPVLGRLFSQVDDYRGCGIQGVVISNRFWQREFGGRTNVIGNKLALDGHPFQIIGVTPPSFYGLEVGRNFDVALPLCSELALGDEAWTDSPTTWWLAAIGRLKPGWTVERASVQLGAISPSIFAATLPSEYDSVAREKYLRFSLRAVPGATGVSSLRSEYERPLVILLAISGLILLIACANLANLMLARASTRKREMALRLTLGASRRRLLRQLLTESLLLASLGAVIGTALAQALSRFLVAFMGSGENLIFLSLPLDLRVLFFTMGLAVLACLLFGVAPALQAAGSDPGTTMKGSGRGLTMGREGFALRRGLIVSQVALSMVLLIVALLFVRTFRNLITVNAGLEQDNILVADFDFSPLKLPVERCQQFKHELLAKVRNTPGVLAAAETSIVPMSGNGWNRFINIPDAGIHRRLVNFSEVSSLYFQTLGIPLLMGRDFNDEDAVDSPPVAIVNGKFAQTFLGNGDPIGKTFRLTQPRGDPDKVYQIVGLAGNTKYRDLREEFGPVVYLAEGQDRTPDPDSSIVIHSTETDSSLISALKDVTKRMGPEVVLSFSVFRTSILQGLGRERLMATLSGFYGALAAILSMVGLYGIISYTVVRRRNEIGIRMAMGASKGNILTLILREVFAMLGVGVLIGIILALAAGGAARTLLFGVTSMDPVSLALATTGLTLVAICASFVPAARAITVQPMEVLREE
jgi:putative ABC transport system permease protein